jgi:mannitol/fructose-specific phosphotransferase system IIA component (Ntr-type)
MALLSALAQVLIDPEKAERLRSASSADEVLEVLASASDDEEDAEPETVPTEGVSS